MLGSLQNTSFDCKIIATGSHLSRSHGYTINEIYSDGIKPDLEIDIKLGDDSLCSIANSLSILNEKASVFFTENKFDFIVLEHFEATHTHKIK